MTRYVRLVCLCLLALVPVARTGGARAAEGGARAAEGRVAPAIAAEIAVDADGGHTRFKVTLSREVAVQTHVIERPDRLVVDLPEVAFHVPPETGRKAAGLINSYRFGLFAPGRSRVVMDLAQPAVVSAVRTEPGPFPGAAVLVIDLAQADRDGFHKAAVASAAAEAAPPAADAVPDRAAADKRPVIVIDAGHGGVDPGANAVTGAFEKDIVLSFAQLLKKKLEAQGRYRIVMTRDDDVFIALGERVRLAQAAHAELFISIHADSISGGQQVRGLTVYTGAERASDDDSAQLADRENKADAAAGVDSGDSPAQAEVMDILQDLTQRETRAFSHRFADRLVGQLETVARLNKNPRREAGFRVLRANDVPSVLVELGYLSSRQDLDHLLSDDWRGKATAAMAAAVDRFFATKLARQGAAAVLP